MPLVTYQRRPVAMVGPRRVFMTPTIADRADTDPLKRFVRHLNLYSRDAQAGRLAAEPRRYLPDRAERYVRVQLMPGRLFHDLRALPDPQLADLFGAPIEQIAERRRDLGTSAPISRGFVCPRRSWCRHRDSGASRRQRMAPHTARSPAIFPARVFYAALAMDLDELVDASQTVSAVADRHESLLRAYWSEDAATFLSDPGKGDDKPHVTTACTSVLSFFDIPIGSDAPEFLASRREAFGRWLADAPWRSEELEENNPYTAPLALQAMAKLGLLGEHLTKVKSASDALADALASDPIGTVAFVSDYPPNGYLTYWAYRALRDVLTTVGAKVWREDDRRLEIEQLLTAAELWGREETYRQLGFYSTAALDRYDALQLGYAMGITDLGDAHRGRAPDMPLLAEGLRVLFASQRPDGLWERGFPIFHFRELGSAYPFAFETLTALLQLGARNEVVGPETFRVELFAPHIDPLLRAFGWVTRNERVEVRPQGWRSNNVPPPDGSPQAWATAMVLSFARGLRLLLDRMARELVLREYHARWPAPNPLEPADAVEDSQRWSSLLDSETRLVGRTEPASLKRLMFDAFIAPRRRGGDLSAAAWSAILFGPPGTAKTTLAIHLAGALRWPLLTLSTSDFLALGVDRMAHQARLIFHKLNQLSDTVVLIDEVEEFVRKRAGGQTPSDIRNRLITTAMLTLLQELRDRERVILLLATNHVEEFDPAIRRPGRFDLVVNVAPPSAAAKREMLQQATQDRQLDATHVAVLENYAAVVARTTFKEWQTLVRWARAHPGFSSQSLGEELKGLAKRTLISDTEWDKWQNQRSQMN
jgi:hypothetical protein